MVTPPRYRKTRGDSLRDLNKNINFDREGEKTNARKWATPVVCITCEKKFVLPFKPRKPEVYCDDCFRKSKKKTVKKPEGSFSQYKAKKVHYFKEKK